MATAVRQVLASPAFARRARELAARAASAQAPARAVGLLAQLARTGAAVVDLADGPVGGVGRRP